MKKYILTILFSTILLSSNISAQIRLDKGMRKVITTMALIERAYVDSIDSHTIAENAIQSVLQELDPHSAYMDAETVAEMDEPLEGNFDGIGIAFNMMNDTLYVIETVVDGPSEKVGVMPGDRIIAVNDTTIAGVKMSTKNIMKRLRGPKGTHVKVTISRKNIVAPIHFTIKRDKIPIHSLDASYMIDNQTGYIRLSRFGATTSNEFKEALSDLRKEGLQNLILDLQSNGGGYLGTATQLTDEFLEKDKLIVYMEGKHQPRTEYKANGKGNFKEGKLVILVDENSASASEIVSGAIQDWDRGIIVGRRTFGKGLVQRPFPLPDGSMIRLTVSRYYTPTGRSIQRPYEKGNQSAYRKDLIERYNRGEMMNADSIHFPDSLKYRTLINHRTVYGGGGIMPDYFVPMDTTDYTEYSGLVNAMGITYKLALEVVDKSRKNILETFPTVKHFEEGYNVSEETLKRMIEMATEDKIEYTEDQYQQSKAFFKERIKLLIARDLYKTRDFFKLLNKNSDIFKKGYEIINDDTLYNQLLKRKNK